ncbi:DUF4232 domain-containing protein [Streptomyces sp. NPDC058420]|uniref:DUF4232 domain-containing protein n=1 Tax=Streptomyces sp. NPDC058420 TaxID=3346489 RepID=UPI0036504B38
MRISARSPEDGRSPDGTGRPEGHPADGCGDPGRDIQALRHGFLLINDVLARVVLAVRDSVDAVSPLPAGPGRRPHRRADPRLQHPPVPRGGLTQRGPSGRPARKGPRDHHRPPRHPGRGPGPADSPPDRPGPPGPGTDPPHRERRRGGGHRPRGIEGEILVNLKDTGSTRCSMHGFPGVQLVGPDGLGDTGPDAARSDASASTVIIGPGEETRFLLHFSQETSGSGKKYTRLDVTPPNETVGEIVNLNDLAITVSPSSGTVPDVIVDPVGYHVGSGK